MDKEILNKINKFTRREFKEEELYVFSVILCDNDIDRDNECFSDNSLETLKDMFVGRTGIFDHTPTATNQSARIFETEIITDSARTTKYGSAYKYLKASAYMVRTDENKNLISEIDGGIKKEVSISCTSSRRKCSVCGNDNPTVSCSHIKGKKYNNKLCYNILEDITDAYEWSFVAVPAQVNAGVTKRFTEEVTEKYANNNYEEEKEVRREIRRLAYFSGGKNAVITSEIASRNMNNSQLMELKKSYERLCNKTGIKVQIMPDEDTNSAEGFSLR